MSRKDKFLKEFWQFWRSVSVGLVATAVDACVLLGGLRVLGFNPYVAKALALGCGLCAQFLGNRIFAFRATEGSIKRQLRWFVLIEVIAFVGAVLIFRGLLGWFTTLTQEGRFPAALLLHGKPDLIANFGAGFVVYFLFSYPLWKIVFRVEDGNVSQPRAEQHGG
ncbi:MAG: GtrA family protein [Deltaproteobacteria bacterium]|nr:GtrA family protein [Deltaproteobacteria bacterium]